MMNETITRLPEPFKQKKWRLSVRTQERREIQYGGPPSTEAKTMRVPCQQVIALFLISGLFLSVRLGELIILVTVAIRLVVWEARQNNLDQLITKETRVATIRKLGGITKDAFMTTQGSEKENKRLLGKKGIKVVRISEDVQNS
jgi:hypothetical protein